MSKPRLAYVVALDANRLIGRDNALPWRLPDDMGWFRGQTLFEYAPAETSPATAAYQRLVDRLYQE